MTITHHPDILQGSDEWHQLRLGILTASEMKLIVTPTLKRASNDKERTHFYELAAQRITKYVEPSYINDDMLRGMDDEIVARDLYAKTFAPVTECGFVTNDRWGFTIGCSPDALVESDGGLEIKSRRQKGQVETILNREMPAEYFIQVQTELLVTERAWWDFVSYSGGLPMVRVRVLPDEKVQGAIVDAATAFEERLRDRLAEWDDAVREMHGVPTERRVEQEMFV